MQIRGYVKRFVSRRVTGHKARANRRETRSRARIHADQRLDGDRVVGGITTYVEVSKGFDRANSLSERVWRRLDAWSSRSRLLERSYVDMGQSENDALVARQSSPQFRIDPLTYRLHEAVSAKPNAALERRARPVEAQRFEQSEDAAYFGLNFRALSGEIKGMLD